MIKKLNLASYWTCVLQFLSVQHFMPYLILVFLYTFLNYSTWSSPLKNFCTFSLVSDIEKGYLTRTMPVKVLCFHMEMVEFLPVRLWSSEVTASKSVNPQIEQQFRTKTCLPGCKRLNKWIE